MRPSTPPQANFSANFLRSVLRGGEIEINNGHRFSLSEIGERRSKSQQKSHKYQISGTLNY